MAQPSPTSHEAAAPLDGPVVTIVPEPPAPQAAPQAIWDTAERARRAARSFHQTLLFGSLAVVALAAVLNVRGETQVALPILGIPLPELCYWRRLAGVECPGCGLTRCFISLAHFDLARAWHFNPAGIAIFCGVLFQVPYRSWQLFRLRRGWAEYQAPALNYVAWAVIVLLLGQWIWRVAT
jgi:hypothetical protein